MENTLKSPVLAFEQGAGSKYRIVSQIVLWIKKSGLALADHTARSYRWLNSPYLKYAAVIILMAGPGLASKGFAQMSDNVIRVGFITDLSGPYKEVDGPAGAEMVKMAIADMGNKVNGKQIEVFIADHHNDVKLATATAEEWFKTKHLDVLIGGVNSDVGLALAEVARKAKKPFIIVGSGTTEHTTGHCSPYTIHYSYDTYAQGSVTGAGVAKAGKKSFFMLTAEYPFGIQLGKYATEAIKQNGGKIVGAARHSHDATDFSPFLQQADSSRAQVLVFANGHSELVEAVKQANALGLNKRMTYAGTFVFITEIHDLGLKEAQGMIITDSWYWSRDAATRSWSNRFFKKFNRMPSSLQAADYSAVLQYLKAAKSINSDNAEKILSRLKRTRIEDMYTKGGYIRNDGRMIHDMYLLRVKSPEESTGPWDYYSLVSVSKGVTPWLKKAASGCPLWH